MRWLRALLVRLGRWLERLGKFLVAWAKPAPELNPESGWIEDPADGPPEHWLRYLRERSPWLVRPGLRGHRSRAVGAASVAARRAAPVMNQGPVAPGHTPDALSRAERPNPQPPRPLRLDPAPSVTPPAAATPPPSPRTAAPLVAAPSAPPRSQVAVVRPAPTTAPVAERTGATPPSAARWIRFKGPRATARLEPDKAQPDATEPVSPAQPLGWPSAPPHAAPPAHRARPDSGAGAMGLPSVAAAGSEQDGEPLGETGGRQPSDAEPEWPELPDIPWSEDAWSVPSRQALMKEQDRLTRLRAEQAGSSWSGPLS